VRVAAHGVEIHERKRGRGGGEDRVVAGLQRLAIDGVDDRAHGAGERI
jgi:hypothetical protein